MRRWITLLALPVVLMLMGCGNSQEDISSEPCYFYFSLANHPASILRNSLTGINSFVRVRCGYRSTASGARVMHVYVGAFGANAEEDNTITSELELRHDYVLGVYNLLYIGYSTGDNKLMAYDGQCPNCYGETGLTRYALDWSHSGLYVRCSSCGREYDLNNRGFVVDGNGKALIRYNVGVVNTVNGEALLVTSAR